MKWRETETEWVFGDTRKGGRVEYSAYAHVFWWEAWVSDAGTLDSNPGDKTLIAAQRAVEKWLEKHG